MKEERVVIALLPCTTLRFFSRCQSTQLGNSILSLNSVFYAFLLWSVCESVVVARAIRDFFSSSTSPPMLWRGFRTRGSSSTPTWNRTGGLGGMAAEKGSALGRVLRSALLGKKDALSYRWKTYESELRKLPEGQQTTFTDGFVKGLLAGKTVDTSSRFRLYVGFVAASILLAYLMTGERQLGSLLFSSSQEVRPEDVHVTLNDVRGMNEAKQEVSELVAYLKDPDYFCRLGARLPKGVLLVGPPGTGKTLLARAVAGEAGVPFFHTSGSEFDEVLVGQGARRVRDLFDRAKARAPCIIFIDEIDSVGSKRVSNGMHPYANQTINQLLSEMDGFHRNEGIIVMAATNRVEDLDKALLRPGRFDVRVVVTKPDLEGRTDILQHYLGKIKHDSSLDPLVLAKGTTGFTGADIESMVNSAALRAAMAECEVVAMAHLDEARDRVLMGPARLAGRIPDENANRSTAFHEAGHTLVALYSKHSLPVHKVTIIPRGMSMGHTAMLPDKDEFQLTKQQMLAQLDVMMGGRVAEELIFGEDAVTTGAADDLRKATTLATQMVKQYGMSEKVGLRDFSADDSSSASLVKMPDMSPQTSEVIDAEITRLLNESYARAKAILVKYKKEHNLLAEALLEHETLSAEEIRAVLAGQPLRARLLPQSLPSSTPTTPSLDLRGAIIGGPRQQHHAASP